MVLPFENLTSGERYDYFSEGLTEEMITELARLSPERLGVIARTSAMQFKSTTKNIAQIGSELGVSHVLEGSVRRVGERVRITAQLIRVSDESHLWAQSYERGLHDVLEVQVEVARAVAREIQIKLTPHEQAPLRRAIRRGRSIRRRTSCIFGVAIFGTDARKKAYARALSALKRRCSTIQALRPPTTGSPMPTRCSPAAV